MTQLCFGSTIWSTTAGKQYISRGLPSSPPNWCLYMLCNCVFRQVFICLISILMYNCRFIESSHGVTKRAAQAAAISVLLSPGLLIIDHIHFQYNGAMYGILILSLVFARHKSGLLASGLVFAALLCMKHIYLYLAPAYFVYLLRTYCLSSHSIFRIQFLNCVKLGSGILSIFGLAFGPFALKNQIPQILSRLFPFSRGLCHAYWAPNVWAMYSFVDRVLIFGKSCLYHL